MRLLSSFTLMGITGAVVVSTAPATRAATFFFEDFETGVPSEIGGAGFSSGSFGSPALGLGNSFFRNTTSAPTTLSLSGLPAHTSIDLNFTFAAIDSWDGSYAQASPDFFNVNVDGTNVFSETFDNFEESDQSYVPPAGTQLTPRPFADLGFNSRFGDSVYNIALTDIPQTASTLTIDWFASGAGFQGGLDESFAIDNIEVVLNDDPAAVPEPSLMLGSLVLGAGSVMRRLKQKRAG